MFWRRQPPAVTLDAEAYGRWLRACQPQPLAWFLSLPLAEQVALASIGEGYMADIVAAIGYAAQSPQAAAAISAKSDPEGGERRLLESLATMAVRKAMGRVQEASPAPEAEPARPGFGGIGGRRRAAQERGEVAQRAGLRWLGREPDA